MRFELLQPQSMDEAVSLLSAHREEARIIAGGQSLLLLIRSGLVGPGFWVSRMGSTPVGNFGPLGGTLCHKERGSDPPPALLALNATAECVSPRGKRKLPLSQLFTGYFETCLEPDEILAGVEIPPLPSTSKSVYLKHTIRFGDLAIVGVAAMTVIREGVWEELRLALGGVGPVPFRATKAENLLRQTSIPDSAIDAVAEAAAEMCDPISDAHASADYRKAMVRVFVRRALQQTLRGGAREG